MQTNEQHGPQRSVATSAPNEITATIERITLVLEDDELDVFDVELRSATGVWPFMAGSESDLKKFFEGVSAGAALSGMHFSRPDVPTEANHRIVNDLGRYINMRAQGNRTY